MNFHLRLTWWHESDIIPLEARHSSRQHQSVIIGIVRDERHSSLRIVQAVRPRVVRMAGIPLLLGLQPVLPVPLHQGRQSIGADAINNSDTLCYCRCEYYFSNRGQKQACYVLTGNVSTLTVSVHTSVFRQSLSVWVGWTGTPLLGPPASFIATLISLVFLNKASKSPVSKTVPSNRSWTVWYSQLGFVWRPRPPPSRLCRGWASPNSPPLVCLSPLTHYRRRRTPTGRHCGWVYLHLGPVVVSKSRLCGWSAPDHPPTRPFHCPKRTEHRHLERLELVTPAMTTGHLLSLCAPITEI